MKGCEEPIYPWELPLLSGPYLLGLCSCVVFGLWAIRGFSRVRAIAQVTAAALAISSLGVYLHYAVFLEDKVSSKAAVALGAWWLCLGGSALTASGWKSWEWRATRLTSTAGAICVIWFVFNAFEERPLYGLWVSLAASVGLAIGAVLTERRVLGRPSPGRD